MSTNSQLINQALKTNSGIDATYTHVAKTVTTGEPIVSDGSVLKWYDVAPADTPIPNELRARARARLTNLVIEASGFGFVVLHRCGNDFYFLIISIWRNNNELWETVWYADHSTNHEFAFVERNETYTPTFCVWELTPVQHERGAWIEFLASARDENAVQTWLADQCSGQA
ncbi:MAG: hypothetical protein AB8G95_25850 [Anaerolineae bacterium]